MRSIRLGRTSRLVLLTVVLILIIPIYFLNQLESIDHVENDVQIPVDNNEMKTRKKSIRLQNIEKINLHPVMSRDLGNYEPRDLPERSGPGEGGKTKDKNKNSDGQRYMLFITGVPVILSAEEEREAKRTITNYGFNMVASDKISLDRRIKDTRPAE